MANNIPSLDRLIDSFASLPGVGRKSASRFAYHVLDMNEEDVIAFSEALAEAKRNIHQCPICHNLTDSDKCSICDDDRRDRSVICVVESARDVNSIERTHEYKGLYHVLHGVFNPMKSMSISDTTIPDLLKRLADHPEITEVIVATNQTAEGNATALYLSRMLGPSGIKVSRLASGLPMGSDIEYADDLTLLSALKGRVMLTGDNNEA